MHGVMPTVAARCTDAPALGSLVVWYAERVRRVPIGLSSDSQAVCHCIHIDGDAAAAAAAAAADDCTTISSASSRAYLPTTSARPSDWRR